MFPFSPYLIMLVMDGENFCSSELDIVFFPAVPTTYTSGLGFGNSAMRSKTYGKQSGNTFFWYADSAQHQYNYEREYRYVAIG